MKNILFASTAIVAAGFAASTASAAEPIKGSVHGYYNMGLGYDDSKSTEIGVIREGEVFFDFNGSSDNGLSFDGRVEMEMSTGTIDEAWGSVSGAFGRVRVGSNDGAADSMERGVLYGPSAWAGYYDGKGNSLGNGTGTDSVMIEYRTPRIAGFQAAVSWHPDADLETVDASYDDDAGLGEVWSAGVNYGGDFGDVGVEGSFSYENVDGGDEVFVIGLQASVAGFTGAAQYSIPDEGNDTVALGLSYGTGPWSIGGGVSFETEGTDETEGGGWISYALAPGATAFTGFTTNDTKTLGFAALALSF